MNKIINGVIFNEDFKKENLMWSITPQDTTRYQFTANGIILKHGEGRVLLTLPSPCNYEKYFMEAEIEHDAIDNFDYAGFIIMSTDEKSIECQSYFNSNINKNYKYIRIMYDDGLYTFYISYDKATWEELGNSRLTDAQRIGFFIDNIKTPLTKDLLIKKFIIRRSSIVEFDNINSKVKNIIFRNSAGTIIDNIPYIQKNNRILMDLKESDMPFSGNIEIINTDGVSIFKKDMVIDGGEVYANNDNLKVYINNKTIDNDQIFDLGTFFDKISYSSLNIYNDDEKSVFDKEISIEKYDYVAGDEEVEIAIKTDNDYSKLQFTKSVKIAEIKSKETVELIMKIDRTKSMLPVDNDYKFRLNIY